MPPLEPIEPTSLHVKTLIRLLSPSEPRPGGVSAQHLPPTDHRILPHEFYFAGRATALAPGSRVLQRQTGRYLQAFFGSDRRLDEVMRHDARAFKTALGAGHSNLDTPDRHRSQTSEAEDKRAADGRAADRS